MRRTQLALSLLLAIAAHVAGATDLSAQSFGFYGMPSRFTQYLGYGYGAGHHAPIARTPGIHPARMPRKVVVSGPCGAPYTAEYQPLGCYGQSCDRQAPAAEPVPAPLPMLPPAPTTSTTPAVQPAPGAPATVLQEPPPERHALLFASP
jgi:hypothetical protein